MKKKIYISIIILTSISIFILLIFHKSKLKTFDDIIIFSLWNENQYTINPQNNDKVQIDIFQTIQNGTKTNKKIAPGSYGKFTIKLIKPLESSCELFIKELGHKPKNLIFELDGYKYNSIEDMQENINTLFQINDQITINWKWQYDVNNESDLQDTEDGERAGRYIFEITALIEQD